MTPIPVVFDTDIGSFADDSLALALALLSPELDVRLVLTTSGDVRARAQVAALQLQLSGRDDVAVGIGVGSEPHSASEPLFAYSAHVDLGTYRGGVTVDGVGAAAAAILSSGRSDWVVLQLGPASTMAELIRRYPQVAPRARLVAMGTSICSGIRLPWGSITPLAATNERRDVRL